MKYFKKQKWRTGINLKPYESEKKSEIMWVNVKVGEKKKRKGFYGGIKTIWAKNNCTNTKFTPALSRIGSLNNTT